MHDGGGEIGRADLGQHQICDIAAGIVIVTEAGGKVTNFDGSLCTLDSKQVIASNGKIHIELMDLLN